MKRGFRIYSDQNESLGFVESQEPLTAKEILSRFSNEAEEGFFRDGTDRVVKPEEVVPCGSVLIFCARFAGAADASSSTSAANASVAWVRLSGSTARVTLRPGLENAHQIKIHLINTFGLSPNGHIENVQSNQKLQPGNSYRWIEEE